MSVRIMSRAWDAELPSTDKLVLLALADWSDDHGRCWPSIAQLVDKCGLSERAIQGAIKRLKDGDHLSRDEKAGKGVDYTIHPRSKCTPAVNAPPQETTKTPAAGAPNTSVTTSSNEGANAPSLPRARFDPPTGVAKDQWDAFRKQRRKPINARSYLLLCNKLARLAEDGWPPGEMIDLAIERGWETVFAPRDQRNGRRTDSMGRHQPADGLSSTARAALAVFGPPGAGNQ